MPSLPTDNASAPTSEPGGRTIGALLVICMLAAIGLPVVGAISQLIRGWTTPASAPVAETPLFVWPSIWHTLWATLAIAALATLLALPMAWSMQRPRIWWVGLVAVPMLMPTYFAYAGWGLLRGPGSWLGDWLAHGTPARSLIFDKGLAVVGLALWAWPIAACIVGAAARRIPVHLLEAIDLEPAGVFHRWRVIGGLLGGSIAASIGLIALIMAGSAVPLHLAQVDTYTIHLWLYLNSASDRGAIWPATLPLLLIAGGGAWVIVRALRREQVEIRDEGVADDRRESRAAPVLAAGVWGLSVIVPLVLFFRQMRQTSSLLAFWKGMGREVLHSVGTSATVGAVVAIVCICVWAMRSCGGRNGLRTVRGGVWVWIAAAILPGVLIGVATSAFWNSAWLPRAAGDSIWPVVLAHVARFGFVGAVAGWWLAGMETTDERGARLLLAGGSVRAWATLCLRPQLGAVIGIGLAVCALSLHEIESTIMVQPPGQSLAQYVLNQLHYNRNDELCAACVNVMGMGIVLAGVAGWLIARGMPGRMGKSRESAPPGEKSGI